MRMLFQLFISFTYVGAFTWGGGYAMLPMFKRELVERRGWLTDMEMTDFFSVSQCLPGIIAGNTAVFVGYKKKGVAGGLVSIFGVAFPSLVIMLIVAAFITNFADIEAVQKAFAAVRVCVSVMILNTVAKLWKQAIVDKTAIVIFVVVFLVSVFTNLPVAILIVAAGLAGVGISTLKKRSKGKPGEGGKQL